MWLTCRVKGEPLTTSFPFLSRLNVLSSKLERTQTQSGQLLSEINKRKRETIEYQAARDQEFTELKQKYEKEVQNQQEMQLDLISLEGLLSEKKGLASAATPERFPSAGPDMASRGLQPMLKGVKKGLSVTLGLSLKISWA